MPFFVWPSHFVSIVIHLVYFSILFYFVVDTQLLLPIKKVYLEVNSHYLMANQIIFFMSKRNIY